MTLDEALVTAYNSNPQIASARAQVRVEDEDIAQVNARWRPAISASADGSINSVNVTGGTAAENDFYSIHRPTDELSLTVDQLIFQGSKGEEDRRSALSSINAAREKLSSTEQNVLISVVTDYCDVVRDNTALDLHRLNQAFLETKLKSANAALAAGAGSRADVALVDATLQQERADYFIAQSNLASSEFNFARDVGVSPSSLDYPTRSLDLPVHNASDAASLAGVRNHDVLAAEYALEAQKENSESIKYDSWPAISLEGQAAHRDAQVFGTEHQNDFSVTLHVKIPIYTGGQLASEQRADREKISKLSYDVIAQRASAGNQARTAWALLMAKTASVEAYRAQIIASQISLEGTLVQQAAGERTVLDVLNAQRELLQAKMSLANTVHDRIVAEYSLAAVVGMSTAKSLHLPTTLYDPARHFDAVKNKWF